MSGMTWQATTGYDIVQKVRASLGRKPNDPAQECVDWIFDRLSQILTARPDADYREAWGEMKKDCAWKKANFTWEQWQRASSRVSSAFDRRFQAPVKYRKPKRIPQGGRRSGRRCPDNKGRWLVA